MSSTKRTIRTGGAVPELRLGRHQLKGFGSVIGITICLFFGIAAIAAEDYPPISHFSSPDGQTGFVLDLSGDRPMMRTDRSVETLILYESLGPRGDRLFKLKSNYLILRRTNIGGYIFYDRFFPDGRPVTFDGPADSLEMRPMSIDEVKQRAEAISTRLSDRIGSPLVFKPVDWNNVPGSMQGAAVLHDAMQVTAAALRRITAEPIGREAVATELSQVVFMPSETVSYEVQGDSLNIYYVWHEGYEGRPDSNDIFRHLELIL